MDMAVARSTGFKAKADTLFSRLIRFHGACENCDYVCPWECDAQAGTHRKGCKLQCAHIITRHQSATRCDTRNAFALCAKCHHRFGLWPVEFADFIIDKGKRADYDALSELVKRKPTVNWEDIYDGLCREWDGQRTAWGL